MGERTDQIERHIKRQRDELEDNFSELERKVKDAFDWRTQFQEHPGTMLAAALVGGALVGALLPGRSSVTAKVTSRRRSFSESPAPSAEYSVPNAAPAAPAWNAYSAPSGEVAQRTAEVWDNLKGAAITMAAARLGDAIEGLVPGFADHYKKAAGNNQTRGAKAAWPYSVPKPADSSSTAEASQQKPNGGTDYGSHS
jgi:hypothetical protein